MSVLRSPHTPGAASGTAVGIIPGLPSGEATSPRHGYGQRPNPDLLLTMPGGFV